MPSRREVKLPESLGLAAGDPWTDNDRAVVLLRRYFSQQDEPAEFTGSFFDTWHVGDPNEITAHDVLAVEFLSVRVPPQAVRHILGRDRNEITALLNKVGPDEDLATYQSDLSAEPSLNALWKLLNGYRGLGRVTASKILARKRPRLVPVFDSVVSGLVGVDDHYWSAWQELFRSAPGLHARLEDLRAVAGVPEQISVLRALDVVLWMHATSTSDASS